MKAFQLFFLVTLIFTFQGALSQDDIIDEDLEFNPIRSYLDGEDSTEYCYAWRLGVEANNIRHGVTPNKCADYLKNYVMSHQYRMDSKLVRVQAYNYLKKQKVGNDGKDIWIFDIDETALSNVASIFPNSTGTQSGKWSKEYNVTDDAPALKETLYLYKRIKERGFKIVFLSGRPEHQREVTESNLQKRRYFTYEKLILKDPSYNGYSNALFKETERAKLVESGYRIVGNVGDQWSDILGQHAGDRTFKLPNPMYYTK